MIKEKIKLSVIILSGFLLRASVAKADWSLPNDHGLPDDFDDIAVSIINWLLGLVISLSVIALIWGGIRYISAAGSQELAQGAKKTIQYALIGLIVAGLSYALVNVAVNQIFT